MLFGIGIAHQGLFEDPDDPSIVKLVVGLVVVLVGILLTLAWRQVTILNPAQRVALERSGSWPLIRTKQHTLADVDTVRVEREFEAMHAEQGKGQRAVYYVRLSGDAESITLATRSSTDHARQVARRVADFLSLPIVDECFDQADDAPQARDEAVPHAWPMPPIGGRIRWRVADGAVQIDLPPRGLRSDTRVLFLASLSNFIGWPIGALLSLGDVTLGLTFGGMTGTALFLVALGRTLNRQRVMIGPNGLATSPTLAKFLAGSPTPLEQLDFVSAHELENYARGHRAPGGQPPIVLTDQRDVIIFGGEVLNEAERDWLIDVIKYFKAGGQLPWRSA
jgi:hypothetical protein